MADGLGVALEAGCNDKVVIADAFTGGQLDLDLLAVPPSYGNPRVGGDKMELLALVDGRDLVTGAKVFAGLEGHDDPAQPCAQDNDMRSA
ncbi:hypothetical protein [Ruegeria aquimaris]|uniref:Uncharacterized protein n=1 Tax=Ruegeria aquimaris TaxID=2984333 RepID=A0ABT3AEZ6_9RHOB|nr:hypothetical protein [Ruegeria sp. XHP0148]MCV2887241.1 hypothetical protein [Ruegeria sp. XHP0148]